MRRETSESYNVTLQYVLNSVGNIDDAMVNRVQRSIQQIFLRVCVLGVQYLGPTVFIFASSLLLQKKGEHSTQVCAIVRHGLSKVGWNGTAYSNSEATSEKGLLDLFLNREDSETKQALNWMNGVSSSQVFTAKIFRPIVGFLLWWGLVSTFCVSALGLVYNRRKTLFANVSKFMVASPDNANEMKSKEWKAAQKKFK